MKHLMGHLCLRHEVVAIAIHHLRTTRHTHRVGHITSARNEGLALGIELLTLVAARDRMLVPIRFSVERRRWELSKGISARCGTLHRCRHRSIVRTIRGSKALRYGIRMLLIHRWPGLIGHIGRLLVVRIRVTHHRSICHLWSHLVRHTSSLERLHASLKVPRQIIAVLHLIIWVHHRPVV